jgi:hypothetical protein|nr:MAG TPA: hypothetical protein [Caudoviricetes sp.]
MNTAASAYSKKRKSPYVINNIRVTPKSIKIGYEYLKGGRAEKPRSELYDAMKNLASHVASLLEIENLNLNHRIKPTLVKYAYDNNGMMSAVIESNFSIPIAGAHVVIRTPSKQEPFDPEKNMDEKKYLFPNTVDALRKVQDEVELYIKGERAQGSLFDGVKKSK